MGTDVYAIKKVGNFIGVNSEVIDKLMAFQIDSDIVITIGRDELKKLIKETKGLYEKDVYQQMLNEIDENDEYEDFIIG